MDHDILQNLLKYNFYDVDPLADAPANIGTSPYTYVWNNPLRFIDPDGRHGTSHHEDEDGKIIASYDDADHIIYIEMELQKMILC